MFYVNPPNWNVADLVSAAEYAVDALTVRTDRITTPVEGVTYTGSIAVSGRLYATGDSVPCGVFHRTIHNGRIVRHDDLKLEPSYRQQGVGTEFVRASLARYRELGITSVELDAGSQTEGPDIVGSYVWAAFGFDWQHDQPINDIREIITSQRETFADPDGLLNLAVNGASPRDLSQFGRTDGADVWDGKTLMLRLNWRGVMRL